MRGIIDSNNKIENCALYGSIIGDNSVYGC